MRPWKGICRAALALAACGATAAAAADDPAAITYGITAFAGYRFGGHFDDSAGGESLRLDSSASFALALDAATEPGRAYEVFYAHQDTRFTGQGFASLDTHLEYLHLGGTLDLGDAPPPWRPYLAGGLGLTRIAPAGTNGREDEHFSLSLALGVRLALSEHLRVRLEGRGYATFIGSQSSLFCRSDESGALCRIRAQGSTLVQGEALAGLSFEF